MNLKRFVRSLSTVITFMSWSMLLLIVAVLIGSANAFFLWSLDLVTHFRLNHPQILYMLPVAGIAITFLYQTFGKSVEGGTNLLLDEIHSPGAGVPARMTPLILLGTLLTHLFGGSAGREGTALQIAGGITGFICKWLPLNEKARRTLLMSGIAAGFASVFGTPLTGALFAMEVLSIGRIEYEALLPCLLGAIVGNLTCALWGIHHDIYSIQIAASSHAEPGTAATTAIGLQPQWILLIAIAFAGIVFGWASLLFSELAHRLQRILKEQIVSPYLRPVAGGLAVILLVELLGTRDYIGLGNTFLTGGTSIHSAFQPGGAYLLSWWCKLIFTVITLSSGFKGGEVTPLFFIGATLGNTLATLLGQPTDLFAALGFIAVFAGASNTPLACTVMGIELFGSAYSIYFAVACFVAYWASGHSGIYLSQKVAIFKYQQDKVRAEITLREMVAQRHNKIKEVERT